MNRQELEKLANSYGFTTHHTNLVNGKLNYIGMMDEDGINLQLYPDTEEFELAYTIPKSVFQVRSGKCGSFTNEAHFMKFLRNIRKYVKLLNYGD